MKKDVEQYMAILRQSYDEQEAYIRQIQGMKHDIQAHMIVLQYYLEEGSYDRAKAYLKQMQSHQERIKRLYIDTGNNMLNALLTERWKQSDAEIEVSCYGEIPKECECSEYDLCTIFSNVFSNAIEACEKLEKQRKHIEIKIEQQKDNWSIKISNPIEWSIDKTQLGQATSKEDKDTHGYGIRNVQNTVRANQGQMEFLIDRKCFEVQITLPFFGKNNRKSLLLFGESDGD